MYALANSISLEQVARVCHEANRAYCESIGDFSQPLWQEAPEWQKDSARKGVELHLAELFAGREPLPSASHESWLKQKTAEGWKYGLTKNAETKEHPCFLPYDQLPANQKVKDYIFIGIVKSFHAALAIL